MKIHLTTTIPLLLSPTVAVALRYTPGDVILGMDQQLSMLSQPPQLLFEGSEQSSNTESHPFYKILPQAMNADTFAGISPELSEHCRTLDLAGTKVDIPLNTTLLFVFNSTRYLSPGCGNTNGGSSNGNNGNDNNIGIMSKFMQTSVPFGLPQYHVLVDYFLLVPANYTQPFAFSPDLVIKEINARKCRLPLFLDMIGTRDPLLALIFKTVDEPAVDEKKEETKKSDRVRYPGAAQKCKERLREVSNSPGTSGIARAALVQSARFFDEFAHLWVSALGLESLYSSVFCQMNEVVTEQSFCLQITTSESRVSVIDPVNHLGGGQIDQDVNPNGHGIRQRRDGPDLDDRDTTSPPAAHSIRILSRNNGTDQLRMLHLGHRVRDKLETLKKSSPAFQLEISPWERRRQMKRQLEEGPFAPELKWSAVFDPQWCSDDTVRPTRVFHRIGGRQRPTEVIEASETSEA